MTTQQTQDFELMRPYFGCVLQSVDQLEASIGSPSHICWVDKDTILLQITDITFYLVQHKDVLVDHMRSGCMKIENQSVILN